jgi:Asp-tRNA(Asn)/Glu-tRNA(Gln) amidotransferase A subunit family amidase
MAFAEYSHYDGLGLAALVAKRQVTPLELAEEAISRIERHNPRLNAVVFKMYDLARETARRLGSEEGGRFRGVPFLLKDILGNYAGVPTACGTRFMLDMPAGQDDTLVARYKAAGLVTLGKTNVPEFGLLPTTESVLYGPCHNPWQPDHSTGGSSGGSAAAVAAGIVPFAHANDGGGSIRIPASCCGLVGLKPTRGRNPLGPMLGDIMNGLICEHVVSRTVRDTAAAPSRAIRTAHSRRRGRFSRRSAPRSDACASPSRPRIPAAAPCTPSASPPSNAPPPSARSSVTSSRKPPRGSTWAPSRSRSSPCGAPASPCRSRRSPC